MNTRKTVFLCNMIIIALCVASILSYFIMPFWKVKVEYTLTAETLRSAISSSESEYDDEEFSDSLDDYLDFTKIVGEDGLSLQVSLSLETADILSALSAEPSVVVERILTDNVYNFVDQISATLSQVIKTTVNTLVQSALKEGITTEVHKVFGEGMSDAETQAKLNAAGITDEYLDKKASQLVNSLYEDGATAESVTNTTVQLIEESLQKMKDSGDPDYADLELSEEKRAELTEDLIEQFKNFENADGTLNLDNFTTDFIMDMLAGESGASETAATLATPLSAKSSKKTDGDEKVEQLRQMLTEEIMDALEEAEDTIAMVAKIISYVILVTFAIWLLPIVKILLKMGRLNNAIKVGLPIWFGSIPYIVLCLLPNVALSMFLSPSSVGSMMGGLSITFSSCAVVSFVVGIALAVFVLFFYGKQRRTLKRGGGYVHTTTEE